MVLTPNVIQNHSPTYSIIGTGIQHNIKGGKYFPTVVKIDWLSIVLTTLPLGHLHVVLQLLSTPFRNCTFNHRFELFSHDILSTNPPFFFTFTFISDFLN